MYKARSNKENKKTLDIEREQKAIQYAEMVINDHKTVRQIASEMGVSKSTVHNYLKTYIDSKPLQDKVNAVMRSNYSSKHIRGGEATKKKYSKENHK